VRGEEGLRERDRKAEAARERAVVIVDGSPRAVDLLTLLRHHCVPLTTLLRGHVTLLRRPLTTLLRVTHFSLTSLRQCYQRATYLLSAHSVSSWGH